MDRLVNTPLSNVEECFFTQKQHHQLIQIKEDHSNFLNNSNGLLLKIETYVTASFYASFI